MSSLDLGLLDTNQCEFFAQQRDYEASMLRRYNILIFCVATAVVASLIGLIVAAAISEWGVAAATAVGTIVSGTAMKFVLDQRREHAQRINKWIATMKKHGCA